MFIHEINNSVLEEAWYSMPDSIYAKYSNKPLMLQSDVQRAFNHQQNSLLRDGKACRWLLFDEYNLPAARIAALYTPENNGLGRIGFFECITNPEAAYAILETALTWLRGQGCNTVEGPVNFGEKDRFWGLMTKGFDTQGLYLDNFNPSYYKGFFTCYGFQQNDIIYTFKLKMDDIPVQRICTLAEHSAKAGYGFRHFQWQLRDEMIAHIHTIYTRSFEAKNRISHISTQDIQFMLDSVKPLLNEKHFWIAYYKDNPVGFILFLKEPAQWNNPITMLKGFAIAIVPEARRKGVEAGLMKSIHEQLRSEEKQYEIYLSGINAKTTKMCSLIQKLGGVTDKIHQTFIFKFN